MVEKEADWYALSQHKRRFLFLTNFVCRFTEHLMFVKILIVVEDDRSAVVAAKARQ